MNIINIMEYCKRSWQSEYSPSLAIRLFLGYSATIDMTLSITSCRTSPIACPATDLDGVGLGLIQADLEILHLELHRLPGLLLLLGVLLLGAELVCQSAETGEVREVADG